MFDTSARTELTDELVVDGSTPSTPVLSPNGRWVAFIVTPVGRADELPVSALWIARAERAAAAAHRARRTGLVATMGTGFGVDLLPVGSGGAWHGATAANPPGRW
jgi:hypothetical protein